MNKWRVIQVSSAYVSKLPAKFPKSLLESAVSLESMGLSELAWKRDDAVQVINVLAERGYAILGGDVLAERNGELTHTYDSWFVNEDKEIPWKQFVLKSRDVATSYIKRYSKTNERNFYYVVVFKSLEEAGLSP